ncbi:hypothetical protein ACJX0J_039902 [Zea mays]
MYVNFMGIEGTDFGRFFLLPNGSAKLPPFLTSSLSFFNICLPLHFKDKQLSFLTLMLIEWGQLVDPNWFSLQICPPDGRTFVRRLLFELNANVTSSPRKDVVGKSNFLDGHI